jgi:hypothetical protein
MLILKRHPEPTNVILILNQVQHFQDPLNEERDAMTRRGLRVKPAMTRKRRNEERDAMTGKGDCGSSPQ